ncbi:hypothetical protein [Bacillus sp. Cr_A10]|uniref:hypothetical protein n=1 Tax=Bacillus sp. Cr_A10 TaxID=3033993 RepID=UPI0023DAE2F4|nr:hypothetical protein [Bacillus sp. Cr_A10]MDF2064943.1 hypothetical protein [Bacillus sp. Cr_A10]
MNANRKTAVVRQITKSKENKMKITTSKLIQWAGLTAMLAGCLFIVIQIIHPADILSSVTTERWAIVHYLSIVMCLFGMLGIAGIYARQVEEAGWLGLIGYLMFSLFYALTLGFNFTEAFISPLLLTEAPRVVETFLALASGSTGEVNIGALAGVYTLVGVLYMIGGPLFGLAMLRAGILPRWATGLFASGGPVSAIVVSLLPHPLDRIAAVPLGIGLAWLGYALWSERRENASKSIPSIEASSSNNL